MRKLPLLVGAGIVGGWLLALPAMTAKDAPPAPAPVVQPVAPRATPPAPHVTPVVPPATKVAKVPPKRTSKPVVKPQTPKKPKVKPPVTRKVKPKADEATIRRDCESDAWRLCTWSIPQGRQAIIACMVQNKKNLSKQCSQHV